MSYAHLLTQTITVQERSGTRDNAGDPTYDAATVLDARVEKKSRLVRDDSGNEIATSHSIATTTEIGSGARIWLPNADTSDINEALEPVAREYAETPDGDIVIYMTHV